MLTELKIGDFLHRKKVPVKILPDEEYSLVTVKLYHKGVILREKKKGSLLGSNMYRVSAGDFILSGIDARNGAFGIIPEELEGAIVTNDFWYFDVDESKVKRDFFYWLTTTPLFLDACQKSSKGETQRIRLQKNLFNEFIFHFPPIEEQDSFLQSFGSIDKSLSSLKMETFNQSSCLTKLRQAILQEAIEGKLTADWRKEQEESLAKDAENAKVSLGELRALRENDPDYNAKALLEKIQAEKEKLIKEGKIKKQKPLPPIKAEEVPFELPEGWVWTRLGELIRISSGDGLIAKDMVKIGEVPVFGGNGINGYHDISNVNKPTIVIGRVGALCGAIHLTPSLAWVTDNAFITSYNEKYLDREWLIKLLKSLNLRMRARETAQPVISGQRVYPALLPLPPLAEQQAIVDRVEKLLSMVDELEKQVSERKEQSEQLMQAVLREAFEGES